MGIRETLNENPRLATGIASGLIGVALICVVWSFWPSSGPKAPSDIRRFYSDDDGATYFKDSISKIPPFQHNGREAVVAMVFRGAKGQPFVGYLEKFTELGRAKKAEILADTAHPQRLRSELYPIEQSQRLIKKPGSGSQWVNPSQDPTAATKIQSVTCPDGSPASLVSAEE